MKNMLCGFLMVLTLACSLAEELPNYLKQFFDGLDINRDNLLDETEIYKGIRAYVQFFNYPDQKIPITVHNNLLSFVDVTAKIWSSREDKKLSWSDIGRFLNLTSEVNHETFFHALDVHHFGFINATDILDALNSKAQEKELTGTVKILFMIYDVNKDEIVDLEEFSERLRVVKTVLDPKRGSSNLMLEAFKAIDITNDDVLQGLEMQFVVERIINHKYYPGLNLPHELEEEIKSFLNVFFKAVSSGNSTDGITWADFVHFTNSPDLNEESYFDVMDYDHDNFITGGELARVFFSNATSYTDQYRFTKIFFMFHANVDELMVTKKELFATLNSIITQYGREYKSYVFKDFFNVTDSNKDGGWDAREVDAFTLLYILFEHFPDNRTLSEEVNKDILAFVPVWSAILAGREDYSKVTWEDVTNFVGNEKGVDASDQDFFDAFDRNRDFYVDLQEVDYVCKQRLNRIYQSDGIPKSLDTKGAARVFFLLFDEDKNGLLLEREFVDALNTIIVAAKMNYE